MPENDLGVIRVKTAGCRHPINRGLELLANSYLTAGAAVGQYLNQRILISGVM